MSLLATLAICSAICSADTDPELPPDYFSPTAVLQITARYKGDDDAVGPEFKADSGFVFHRTDVEKVHVMGNTLKNCERDRGACETRELEAISDPPFLNSFAGKTTLVVGGVAIGVGITLAIMFAVGGAGG